MRSLLSFDSDQVQGRSQVSVAVGVLVPLYTPARNGGGPIRTLQALVSAVPGPFEVYVLTGDRDLGTKDRLPVERDSWQMLETSKVYYASASHPIGLMNGFRALRATGPEVLYLNGFFDPRFSIVPQLLWRLGFWRNAVRLLAPRGEFGSGALRRRSMKKRAYMGLYRLLRLHSGVYWHASSEMEAQTIRDQWGAGAAILIRENETLLPESADPPSAVGRGGQTVSSLRAVFLGRIVEHKGLHLALEALLSTREAIDLDVYGPAEDAAYLRRCKALAARTPPNVSVRFLGPVEPDATRQTLAGYEVMLMPTAGENFGHVIAESLSVSCPVVCGPATPWTPTLEDGGGEVASLTAGSWSSAIERRARASVADRLEQRRNAGRAFDRWRARPAAPHVFELLDRVLSVDRPKDA